jgi:hypothetical protein
MKLLFFLIFVLFIHYNAFCQHNKEQIEEKDDIYMEGSNAKSDAFYDSLKVKAEKKKLTKLLYDTVVVSKSPKKYDNGDFVSSTKEFVPFKGKIIGNIYLKKVQVISGSVHDTLIVSESVIIRSLDKMYSHTKDRVIQNNLIFETGDVFNQNIIADNERILRIQPFIEDAKILPISNKDNHDVVDIVVITKDVFPVSVGGSFNNMNDYEVNINNSNLFGQGLELGYIYSYEGGKKPSAGHDIGCKYKNIKGLFVSCLLRYINNYKKEKIQLKFKRNFIHPGIKYGGAIDIYEISAEKEDRTDETTDEMPYTYYCQDFWIGRSFLLDIGGSHENIIVAGRFGNKYFKNRHSVEPESDDFFHNTKLILGSFTFRKIKYNESRMILSFGKTEDVPIGFLFQLTSGLLNNEFRKKPYIGFKLASTFYWEDIGYFGAGIGFGSFIREDRLNESVFRIEGLYFNRLIRLKSLRIRNIIRYNFITGYKMPDYRTIDLEDEIHFLSEETQDGQQKLNLNLESVIFTPLNFYGLRFAFVPFADIGFISAGNNILKDRSFYGTFGFACRLKNESLIFDTIQLYIAYCPVVSDDMSYWNFEFSTSEQVLFRYIEISKPEIIQYE